MHPHCCASKICTPQSQLLWWGGTGGKEDDATLERLRSALQLFEGTHPFHNYTKRRLYRAEAREGVKAKVRYRPPTVK